MDRVKLILDMLSLDDWQKLAFAALVAYVGLLVAHQLAELALGRGAED